MADPLRLLQTACTYNPFPVPLQPTSVMVPCQNFILSDYYYNCIPNTYYNTIPFHNLIPIQQIVPQYHYTHPNTPPSLKPSPNNYNLSSNEADVSGFDEDCDLDIEGILQSQMLEPTHRAPTPATNTQNSTKKKRKQKKKTKKETQRRRRTTSPFPGEDHGYEQSSTEDGASENETTQNLPTCLTSTHMEDPTDSLSGEDLDATQQGAHTEGQAMPYDNLDPLLPERVRRRFRDTSDSTFVTKRQELVESPNSKGIVKDFVKGLREFEKLPPKDGYFKARDFALSFLSNDSLPEKVFWRLCMEVADLAKRENLVDEAAYWFYKVNQLQPFASQGWLEHAKLEEECGRLEACQTILQTGLKFCPFNESLLVKGIKYQEQVGDLYSARVLLARLKNTRLEKSWKTMLEGALFEARAGQLSVARRVFKYLIKNIPRHGPIYHEAYKLEEKCEEYNRAMEIVEKGLIANPRYGPLWFGAFRLYERMAMHSQLTAVSRKGNVDPPVGYRCLHCLCIAPSSNTNYFEQAFKCPNNCKSTRNGHTQKLCIHLRSVNMVSSERGHKGSKGGDDSQSPLSSTTCSRDSSPTRTTEDLETCNISYCSSISDSACDSARSTSTTLSSVSYTRLPIAAISPPQIYMRGTSRSGSDKGTKKYQSPRCEACCSNGLAPLIPTESSNNPIDLTIVRDAVQRAVNNISKELVWKVYFETAQMEERAGNLQFARKAYVLSSMNALPNLRWKVWLGGARTELNFDNISIARELLDRALAEVPRKSRAVVLLECARLEEYDGNLEKARAILRRAQKETKHEWKVFLESILLELRAGDIDAAIEESKAALEVHRGTGRLWAVLIQLQQKEGEEQQKAIFCQAVKEVPKSGEVWCEGARMCMNPLSRNFNLDDARRFLDFAIKFTPQYGDSFIEYLRLELLTSGDAINAQLEQMCVNAEPNYGPMWYHCKFHALNSTRHVLRTAKSMLQVEMAPFKNVYQQAIIRTQSPNVSYENELNQFNNQLSVSLFTTGLLSLNYMFRNCHSLPRALRRKIIFGSEHITP